MKRDRVFGYPICFLSRNCDTRSPHSTTVTWTRISVAKQHGCKSWCHVTMLLSNSSYDSSPLLSLSKWPRVIKQGLHTTSVRLPHWLCLWKSSKECCKSQSCVCRILQQSETQIGCQDPDCNHGTTDQCNSWNFKDQL